MEAVVLWCRCGHGVVPVCRCSESIFEMRLTSRCCSFSSFLPCPFCLSAFSAVARATFLLYVPVASSSRSLSAVGVDASS